MKKAVVCLCCALVTLLSTAAANAKERPPVPVTAEAVEARSIYSHAEALGTLRANESVAISVSVTETISRINFDDGQQVEKDHILVELTSSEEQALLVEEEAAVVESKRQLNRVKKLVKEGNASQSLVDERQRNYDAAQARQIATRERINDRIVKAPFKGTVGLRQMSLGALIKPGDVITTLTDNHQMKLDFSVPAILLAQIKKGLPIEAKSVAYPGRVFTGTVSSIDNQIDPVTRSFVVRAILPNDDKTLKQGMLMTVDLFFNQREAIIAPEEAIYQESKKHFVSVVQKQEGKDISEKREIVLGERYRGEAEVISGLSAGEQVILHGGFKAAPGSAVKIKKASEES